ncbi:putative secreted protein (Por secretion system target) [Ulvibacter sp. MAR_2010_11]|uniref:proprotein convertase P-domain-containing protein n=1 Tax=Ulvibacter sp. MAR_2010_11 TaxID=1250229 RepID=UPI000CACA8B6|nr:proprotein convertase P-domain-containing protein [Ulvibacter sp. MAR_2010_11]PKA83570.1 putative secreted protein (Por secretion system target) [Ulvibacter sp. MAR_2010_11]
MRKFTLLTFLCLLLSIPIAVGQTLSTTATPTDRSASKTVSSASKKGSKVTKTFITPVIGEINGTRMAPFSIDGPWCDPCTTPGSGSALACSAGPNSIIQGIDVSGVTGMVNVLSIEYVQDTQSTGPGNVTVNLFCGPPGANPPPYSGSAAPFHSETFPVNAANDGSCVSLAFTTPPTIDASCATMWVEILVATGRIVHTPASCDGNPATGTHTWIDAPNCGITPPTRFDVVGFPGLDAGYSATFESAAPSPITECGNAPEPIPAGAPGSSSGLMTPSVAVVADAGVIGSNPGEYTLDNVTLNINHTWADDLEIVLVSPAGTRVALTTDNGSLSGLDTAADLVFRDNSANNVTGWDGGAPLANYRAEGGGNTFPVAAGDGPGVNLNTVFAGQSITGNWTIEINDDAGGDFGQLNSYCITFNPNLGDPPVIVCPGDISVDTDPGQCNAVVNFSDAIALDPEDGPIPTTQTSGLPSGSMFPTGVSTVEFSATDSDGNTSTCSFTITVTDMEAPVAVCQDITVEVDPVTGTVTIAPGDIDNGSTDNCGIVTYSLDVDTFDCSDTGANTVNLTVTDAEGNSSSCSATVTVEDNTAPVIVCIGEQVVGPNTVSDSPGTAILDNTTVSTSIVVGDSFTITDLNVALDISHTWVGDLQITLESPAGTQVLIFDGGSDGCSGDNIIDTYDDESSNPLVCNGGSPDAFPLADYIPSNALSAFDGEDTAGTWILSVEDTAGGDTGTINSWSLIYDFDPIVSPPYEAVLDANGMVTVNMADLILTVDEACGYTVTTVGVPPASGSLATLYDANNGGSFGGAVYFDVTVGPEDINVTDIDLNTAEFGAFSVQVYTLVGTYVGNTGNPGAWTLSATGTGTANGLNVASSANLDTPIVMASGTTYGMALVMDASHGHDYSGTGSDPSPGQTSYSNADLALSLGSASNAPFDGSPFTPRIFNGEIHYSVGEAASTTIDFDCSHLGENMVEVMVTDDSGNTAFCTATVNVTDVTSPILVCWDVTIELGPDGTAEVDPADLLAVTEGVYDIMVIGSDNSSGTEGFTDFTVPVSEAANITFDWDYTLNDAPGFDSFGYLLNGVYTMLTDPGLGNQSGSAAVAVAPGDVFGFRSQTDDNIFGNNETVISNFVPGFTGQFDPANWTLTLTNSDGDAFFVEVIPPGPLSYDACGITVLAVDVTEVTCADIGTPVTATVFASDASGNIASCQSIITVVDLLAPELVCPADQTVDPGAGNLFYEVPDYFGTGEASATDNCTDPVVILSQSPPAGTLLPDGVYPVTITAEDEYGNESTCVFTLTVETILGVDDNNLDVAIVMYPNPAQSQVTIANNSTIALDKAAIYDINGKLVMTIDLQTMQGEKVIDISRLASGVYMVQISSDQASVVKRLIKE